MRFKLHTRPLLPSSVGRVPSSEVRVLAEDGELLSGSSPNSLRVGHLGTGECVSVSQKWSFLGSYQLQCSGSRAEIEGMCVRVCVRVSVSGGQARLLPWINLNSGCAAFK